MNNRFGDSRQRFSIRKFTVGVASVLLSFAVFGVSTAKAEQAEEPKGQPALMRHVKLVLLQKQRIVAQRLLIILDLRLPTRPIPSQRMSR